ncbi:hypothetical protein [Ancylobacter mangrovi]|uniref:hypothetical protein n=1 Tax=Ancylobacter mangrovi TaxID=2972472 RepID=UPI002162B7F0|nr:hypothetical protein [Ancylobacter mangrovi]MCS0501934.1 hypothetical protein [Ancylobacter mangrovi]
MELAAGSDRPTIHATGGSEIPLLWLLAIAGDGRFAVRSRIWLSHKSRLQASWRGAAEANDKRKDNNEKLIAFSYALAFLASFASVRLKPE